MRDLFVMQYWLVKQEPADYGWAQFSNDGSTEWTGVRNFQARKNLKEMRENDKVLFYHSGSDASAGVPIKAIVGIARVTREQHPDPTAREGEWVSVELTAERALPKPVSLEAIKADETLAQMPLVRQSRLSVMPVTKKEFERVLQMGGIRRIQAGR
jgi:predicted RNA-binding protein with PUA-like domain